MSKNPKCIDCEQVMILRRSTTRGGKTIKTFECLTCGASQKQREAATPAERAPRRVGDVNAARAAAAFKQYENLYRARYRSGSPLTGWALRWDGRRRAYTLNLPTGEMAYRARDLEDLVEALYETVETGSRDPLALYAVDVPKRAAAAVSKSTHDAHESAAREAARVIDAAFAAAETANVTKAPANLVTETDEDGLGVLIQTPLAALTAVGAPMCSGEGVTDNAPDLTTAGMRESAPVMTRDPAIIRDTTTRTDKAVNDDDVPESGEIGRFKIGDRVCPVVDPKMTAMVGIVMGERIGIVFRHTADPRATDVDRYAVFYDADELMPIPADTPLPPAPSEQIFAIGEQVYLLNSPRIRGAVAGYTHGLVKVEYTDTHTGAKKIATAKLQSVARVTPPEPTVISAPVSALQPMGRAREDRGRAEMVYNRTMDKKKTKWCTCAECGKDFRAGRGDAKTCSVKCRKAYNRRAGTVSDHARELENAIQRLVELGKKYPDQRSQIEKALTDAQYRSERGRADVRKLSGQWD